MTRLLIMIVGVVIVVGGLFLILTRASGEDATALAGLTGDAAAGERVFWASGCASCHHAPDATGEARLVLSGGQRLVSDFGTFAVPNISPDPDHGIGGWTLAEFASALRRGVSPDGRHYYPAFPYTSYTRMTDQDVADLKAFMDTLPPDTTPNADSEIAFPYSVRRGIAAWKWLYLSDAWVLDGADPAGRYLVEALGHCAECHTPRDGFGGLDTARWMAGARAHSRPHARRVRLVGRRHRLLSRDRFHTRLRQRRRAHGRGDRQSRQSVRRRPRRHRGVSQGVAGNRPRRLNLYQRRAYPVLAR